MKLRTAHDSTVFRCKYYIWLCCTVYIQYNEFKFFGFKFCIFKRLIWIHSLDYDTRKICFNSQGIGCVIDWENDIILHDKHCIGILDANAIHFNYLIILSIINLCYISSSTLLFVVSFCYSTCSMLKIHHNIVLHSHMI